MRIHCYPLSELPMLSHGCAMSAVLSASSDTFLLFFPSNHSCFALSAVLLMLCHVYLCSYLSFPDGIDFDFNFYVFEYLLCLFFMEVVLFIKCRLICWSSSFFKKKKKRCCIFVVHTKVVIDPYVVHFRCSAYFYQFGYFSHIHIFAFNKSNLRFCFYFDCCIWCQGFDVKLIDVNRTCKVTKVLHKSFLLSVFSPFFFYVLSLFPILWYREDKLLSTLLC